jgi:hypothetical protein
VLLLLTLLLVMPQQRTVASDLAAWEKGQRHAAEQEMQQMEAEAEAQAEQAAAEVGFWCLRITAGSC